MAQSRPSAPQTHFSLCHQHPAPKTRLVALTWAELNHSPEKRAGRFPFQRSPGTPSRGTAVVRSEFLVTRSFRQRSNTASTPNHHCALPVGPLGARRSVFALEIALTLSSPPRKKLLECLQRIPEKPHDFSLGSEPGKGKYIFQWRFSLRRKPKLPGSCFPNLSPGRQHTSLSRSIYGYGIAFRHSWGRDVSWKITEGGGRGVWVWNEKTVPKTCRKEAHAHTFNTVVVNCLVLGAELCLLKIHMLNLPLPDPPEWGCIWRWICKEGIKVTWGH